MIVLDASVTLAWSFEDEASTKVDALFDMIAKSNAHVPSLWKLDVANGFRMAIRRGRTDAAYRDASLARLGRLPIIIDGDTNVHAWGATLQIADRLGLTPYDAAYLELAQRMRLPLATLDRTLHASAVSIGVQTADTGVEDRRTA